MSIAEKLCVLSGFLVCTLSHGASFDCERAATPVEKRICADPSLSRMDEQLASAYKNALASLDGKERKRLAAEQKSWLSNSRNLCDDLSCLRRSYDTRIKLIQSCTGACVNLMERYRFQGEEHNLLTLRNSNGNNATFSKDLLKRGRPPVLGCETLIDIAVGTAHGNHSYGGICKLGNEKAFFLVCNDLMIGHFNVIRLSGTATRYDLADFTIKNCYGG